MTDDLVTRLRYQQEWGSIAAGEAADRIEELEKQLKQRDSYIVGKDLWCDFVWSVTNE